MEQTWCKIVEVRHQSSEKTAHIHTNTIELRSIDSLILSQEFLGKHFTRLVWSPAPLGAPCARGLTAHSSSTEFFVLPQVVNSFPSNQLTVCKYFPSTFLLHPMQITLQQEVKSHFVVALTVAMSTSDPFALLVNKLQACR